MSEKKSSLEIKIQGHQPIDGNHTTGQNATTEGEYKGRRNSGSASVGTPSTEWPGNGDEPAKEAEKELSVPNSLYCYELGDKDPQWFQRKHSQHYPRLSRYPNRILQTNLVTKLIILVSSA